MRTSLWVSLFSLAFALVGNPVEAQEPVTVGDPFVISEAVGDQTLSAPAYNSVNNIILVVWGDTRNQAVSVLDIFGQMLKPDGALIGSSFAVSELPGSQGRSAAGYSPISNRFLVALSHKPPRPEDDAILGQIVVGQGRLVGVNFPIATDRRRRDRPSVAFDPVNNRYLVVWEDSRTGQTTDAFGQLVSPDGTLVGVNFVISDEPEAQERVDVVYNSASQQFLAVWVDFRNSGTTGGDIHAQFIDPSGALIGPDLALVTEAGDQFRPHLAYDEINDRYLLAWTDCRNAVAVCSAHSPQGTDVFAQLLAGDATAIGPNIPIADDPAEQYRSLVAFNPQDQVYLISWTDERSLDTDIFVQALDFEGTLLGGNTGLVAPNNQVRADVIYNPAKNNFLVTHTSFSVEGDADIHGRFVTVTP